MLIKINSVTIRRAEVSAMSVILVFLSTRISKYIMTFLKYPIPYEVLNAIAIWAEIRQSQYEREVAA